jgi:ankyrin repeat protein
MQEIRNGSAMPRCSPTTGSNQRRRHQTGDGNSARRPKGETRLYRGFTPLHNAVKGGNKDVVEAILEAGADINATTELHQTPLDLALRFGGPRDFSRVGIPRLMRR